MVSFIPITKEVLSDLFFNHENSEIDSYYEQLHLSHEPDQDALDEAIKKDAESFVDMLCLVNQEPRAEYVRYLVEEYKKRQ